MTKRTFVFCANISHYNSWLRKNNLNPQEYRFISDRDMLRGYLDLDVIGLGGMTHHINYKEIYEELCGLDYLGRIGKLDYYEEW